MGQLGEKKKKEIKTLKLSVSTSTWYLETTGKGSIGKTMKNLRFPRGTNSNLSFSRPLWLSKVPQTVCNLFLYKVNQVKIPKTGTCFQKELYLGVHLEMLAEINKQNGHHYSLQNIT